MKIQILNYFTLFLLFITVCNAQESNEIQSWKDSSSAPNLYAAVITAPKDSTSKSNSKYKIINLGPILNSKDFDYAPSISSDGKTLYFVSDRKGSILTKLGPPSHDFWVAKKDNRLDSVFNSAVNIDPVNEFGINTRANEGAASISPDGYTFYFTACYRPDGYGKCDIYSVILNGDVWGRPSPLPHTINSEYWESQPSISPDNSRLYFTSNRTKNNYDIYYSDYAFNTKEWLPAKPLTGINTTGMECFPFISADGETLYFSSNGIKPSYGGLDIYMTKVQKDGTCSKPENLNDYYLRKFNTIVKINTKNDDQAISMPATKDIIYFSSDRSDIPGNQGSLDLFMAYVPSNEANMRVVVSVVDEATNEDIPATIIIKNMLTGRTFKDFVSMKKNQFTFIVMNSDYGDPKDSVKSVDFEMTISSPNYETKTLVQSVENLNLILKNDTNNQLSNELSFIIDMKKVAVTGK